MALRHGAAADDDGERVRDVWAAAGVLVNELARPALALNLPGPTGADPGEPAYLSLRRLLRSPPAWAVTGRPVFVCENPNLLAIAADQLGPRCAPLVCTDGMPAAAQRVLLTQLRDAGATLHYHGDFDWPGLRIGNQLVREHDARPWRFSAADYRAALVGAPRPGRPLDDAAVSALWDDALAGAMLAERLAIDEEAIAEPAVLLGDLRQRRFAAANLCHRNWSCRCRGAPSRESPACRRRPCDGMWKACSGAASWCRRPRVCWPRTDSPSPGPRQQPFGSSNPMRPAPNN
jgi:uncharacterized protein (TIGR02679 family)